MYPLTVPKVAGVTSASFVIVNSAVYPLLTPKTPIAVGVRKPHGSVPLAVAVGARNNEIKIVNRAIAKNSERPLLKRSLFLYPVIDLDPHNCPDLATSLLI